MRIQRSDVAAGLMAGLLIGGCQREARNLGPALPQTAPRGSIDPRIRFYQDNAYQVAQGGRYFDWYGCASCHGDNASDTRKLNDHRWWHGGTFVQVYAAIAKGHRPLEYDRRVPAEQLWQLTAYVRDLSQHTPEKRHRLAVDLVGEPQERNWSGPAR